MNSGPVGFFDSGVGGLSIWQAAIGLLPRESTLYVADSAHAPYGSKTPEQIAERACRLSAYLLGQGAKLIVVACNTATVHAIDTLRARFPGVPFVGVVPVVKVLAEQTQSGVIAVLATAATAASPYLAGLIREFAPAMQVLTVACAGLAEAVEQGELSSGRTRTLLTELLSGVRASGADVAGLGCTHYPFLRGQIEALLGPGVRVLDPALPVARRIASVLTERGLQSPAGTTPTHRFVTTGAPEQFAAVAGRLLGRQIALTEAVAV